MIPTPAVIGTLGYALVAFLSELLALLLLFNWRGRMQGMLLVAQHGLGGGAGGLASPADRNNTIRGGFLHGREEALDSYDAHHRSFGLKRIGIK
jgi:hypothetical protein